MSCPARPDVIGDSSGCGAVENRTYRTWGQCGAVSEIAPTETIRSLIRGFPKEDYLMVSPTGDDFSIRAERYA